MEKVSSKNHKMMSHVTENFKAHVYKMVLIGLWGFKWKFYQCDKR